MTPQQVIAHYRVVSKLGEGGMGAVYRAQDTKLGRDVAIKVLPDAFASDEDRLARLRREAQVLASLNHPNIAAIYGVEDRALVMEMVEGPTLAGPVGEEQALPIIEQLIDALEYAHDRGIVHRDLKPANLKLTAEGRLKVLDFGLAKAIASETARSDPATSPTLTIRATEAGLIMGTAAYMSPEQARGRDVDKRADIWSFGVVVYELLTGRQLFAEETVSDTLAAVLTRDPDLSLVPPRFQRLLKLCLARDPRLRLRDISGARLLLQSEPAPSPRNSARLGWVLAALSTVAACVMAFLPTRGTPPTAPPLRFTLPHRITILVSPDGRWIVRVVGGLFVRPASGVSWRLLPGTEGATDAFWSPDSTAMGFFANGKLSTVRLDGTPPRGVADAPQPAGGSWRGGVPDGLIIFATGRRIRTADLKTGKLGDVGLGIADSDIPSVPVFCPESDNFVYLLRRPGHRLNAGTLHAASLTTRGGPGEPLMESAYRPEFRRDPRTSRWTLFFAVRDDGPDLGNRTLLAVPADPRTGKPVGVPSRVVDAISNNDTFRAAFDVANTGLIVWRPTTSALSIWRFSWFDRNGNEIGALGERGQLVSMELAPDEAWIVANQGYPVQRNWIYNTRTALSRRLTSVDRGNESPAVWSPDSRAVYFFAAGQMWRQSIEPGELPEPLLASAAELTPQDVTADGRSLVVASIGTAEIFRIDLSVSAESRKPERIARGLRVRLTPDGRFLLTAEARRGIFVWPYPPGTQPGAARELAGARSNYFFFSRDGRELFLPDNQALYSHPVLPARRVFQIGDRSLLFPFPYPLRTGSNIGAAARDGRLLFIYRFRRGGAHPGAFGLDQARRAGSCEVIPQQSIAHYRIVSKLGEGGMGAVYRAHDTKLGRDLAIKVLPPALANDVDYIARFQREAQVLAALNHPNIAAIYGLEDNAIVMELVEGAELKGPLPLVEVVHVAKQIADALEAAHERGIVHRDLKPANIRITSDGTVKVLDFGLAKATGAAVTASASAANSPTLTIHATTGGVIIGTAAYMAPEQAAGKNVDRRADIWAFGVVLWEMVTGRQMFAGDSVSDTLASVLKDPVDLTPIPEGAVRTLISRCLERDMRTRLGWIGEARAILDAPVQAAPAGRRPSLLPWSIAVLAVIAAAAVALWPRAPQPVMGKLRRNVIHHPNFTPVLFEQPVAAISPDGDRIAYVAGPKLWIRHLAEDEPRAVDGPVDPSFPFWSPDGRFVACSSNGQIWKVSADGTTANAVADFPFLRGATWSSDGRNFLLTVGSWLSVVPVDGGPRKDIPPDRDGGSFTNLSAVPGRQSFIVQRRPNRLDWFDLTTGKLTPTGLEGTSGLFADGYLVYAKPSRAWASDVWAVPFDPAQGKPVGAPVLLIRGAASPTVSADGTLLYVDAVFSQPVRRDRAGRKLETLGLPSASVHDFAVTSDGRKVAFSAAEDSADIWVIENGRRTRMTTNPDVEYALVWSADGRSLTWWTHQGHLYRKSTTDSVPADLGGYGFQPEQWTRDDQYLLGTHFRNSEPERAAYLRRKKGGGWEVVPLLETKSRYPLLSPDGRYYAHYNFVSGEPHIFVRAFPSGGESWQISTAPSRQHAWSADGRELFFLSGNYVMSASIRTQPVFQAGTPQRLFELTGSQGLITNQTQFQALDDGTFAVLEPVPVKPGATPGLRIVENWKRLLEGK